MKFDLNTSQQRVFDYIVENGSITSMEAIQNFGETRISARIFELKDKGVPITSEYIKVTNRFGESRNVKKYFFG
ncbi:MAG: helix-turn-helix domain-containing protein [Spirochaetia bacterium]|nr:helix-turn-helix domain-containing protein [Spirochaetia bacterium]